MKISTFKKYYAAVVISVPILYQYSIAGGLLDLDVIAMLSVFLISVLGRTKGNVDYKNDLWLIILYTVTITLFNILVGIHYSNTISIIMRTGRYCLYIYIVLYKCIDFFDYKMAMDVYKKVSYLATFYIILQTIVYYTVGITLPNTIGGSTTQAYSSMEQSVGRQRAFYSEPAALAYALLPFIICSLFGDQWQDRDRRFNDAVIVTAAVILSTSGQGVVCVIAVWGIWLMQQLLLKRQNTKRLSEICVVIVIALLVSRSSIIEFALGRIADLDSTGAVSARASGYRTLSLLNPIQLVFGTGYGNYVTENIYGLDVPYRYVNYSSLSEYVFTTGIIGTIMIAAFFLKRFNRGTTFVRVLLFAIALLSLSGSPLTGSFIPIYLSFGFCKQGNSIGAH